MAYVPGFDWDIFISYPRESNQRDPQGLEWVNEFHRILKNELDQRWPDSDRPEIYFDREDFGAADHIEHDLLEAARHSALFLPVLSPRYIAPGKFTLQELDAFCQHGDLRQRIVIVELLPVSDEERPPALHGPKRSYFFVMHEGRPIRLHPKSPRFGDDYFTQLQTVAEDIKDVLQGMRRRAGGFVSDRKQPFADKTVLLAAKENDVGREREDVRAWLKNFGAKVLPDDETHSDQDVADRFKADLRRADLFIQLLSPVDDAIHWSEGRSSQARLQYSAVQSDKRSVPVLQWRKPNGRPEVLTYWDKELMEGPHVLALGLEEFKREIKKTLASLSAPQPPPPASTTPYVYITADESDLELAHELKEMAEGKLAASCEIIAGKNRMRNFRETIKVADAIVFLYGAANPEFVNEWLSTYAKLKANGLAKPPQVEALYQAPPPKTEVRQSLRAPLGTFLRLGSEKTFSSEGMMKIFEILRQKRAAGNLSPAVQ